MKQKIFSFEVICDDSNHRTFILREIVNPQIPPLVVECTSDPVRIADYLDSDDLFSPGDSNLVALKG